MKGGIKGLFKRHIALFIVIIILLVFPISLSNQAKLNMRIIVTGLAIDKSGDEYEVTAQIVRATPGNESPGTSATIEFISEKADTVSLAFSNLMYKAGKVSAYSHTSFVVLGKNIAEEEGAKCLDIFVRDKIIRNSAMVLFAEDKASDEIKKTQNIELSVGLGLQKVFLFMQEESDGLMTTVLEFLNKSNSYAKTSYASVLSFDSSNSESSGGGDSSESSSGGSGESSDSGGSGGESSSSSESSSQTESSGGGGSSGSSSGSESSGSSGGSSSSGSSSSQSEVFKSNSPIYIFVDGKLACKIEEKDELFGFMVSNKKTRRIEFAIDEIEHEELNNAKVSITVKNKTHNYSVRFEDEVPCIDVTININDAEIVEILSEKQIFEINDEIYESIEKAIKKEIEESVSKAFEKAKASGADIFDAYELAYKYHYKTTKKYYLETEKFVEKLKLNVNVNIKKLDY